MGSICVEENDLEFGDCKWLGRTIEFASNVGIFLTNDGKVRLVLAFHRKNDAGSGSSFFQSCVLFLL